MMKHNGYWLLAEFDGQSPEAWETYLVLNRIERSTLRDVDWQFLEIYGDVVSNLEGASLIVLAQGRPILTDSGRIWLQNFRPLG